MRLRQVRSRSYRYRREHWLNEHPCQRTGITNQIRAFLLERGVAVRQGLRFLRTELLGILATRSDVLSPCVYRKLKPGRNDDEARLGSGLNE
jgi:hypothetical protein